MTAHTPDPGPSAPSGPGQHDLAQIGSGQHRSDQPRPAQRRRDPCVAPGWWIPALALAGAIWVLSSSADTLGPPLRHPLDWAAHFLSYLALGYALGRATGRPALAWVLAAWWGAGDEINQAFVPGREAGIGDWWFDLLGSGLGAWLAGRACLKRGEERADRSGERPGDEGSGPHA